MDEDELFFGKGLRELGNCKDRILANMQIFCKYANSRVEWIVAAQAELLTGSVSTL